MCRLCGEDWNHAEEDCYLHPSNCTDWIYDALRDHGIQAPKEEDLHSPEGMDN